MARMTGTVKWFNDAKGYGFIGPDNGADVFVHFTGIRPVDRGRRSLEENARVEFSVVPGQNGKDQADDVIVID